MATNRPTCSDCEKEGHFPDEAGDGPVVQAYIFYSVKTGNQDAEFITAHPNPKSTEEGTKMLCSNCAEPEI